jgi:hypothetical protein
MQNIRRTTSRRHPQHPAIGRMLYRRSECNGSDRLGVDTSSRLSNREGDLCRSYSAISFKDDVTPAFEAMAEYCATHRVTPDSLDGCSLASRLFDLLQAGYTSKTELLTVLGKARKS